MADESLPLSASYDVALFDLDGVMYAGEDPIAYAAEAAAEATARGMHAAYVTNNAARTPQQVREKLHHVGVEAETEQIISSALVAADIIAARFPQGSKVLIVGTEGLVEAIRGAGLMPVYEADDEPVAVAQGYGPQVNYHDLAEAVVAVRNGAFYVATNLDSTLPSPRGLVPGNGSLVQVVCTALGRRPDAVAGKPDKEMQTASVKRTGAQHPLVVGDRLDTDIEGAANSGCDSLLVFTGVTSPVQLLMADPEHRPTYIGRDLRSLNAPPMLLREQDGVRSVDGWQAGADGVITGDGDKYAYLWLACAIAWAGEKPVPGDAAAETAHLGLGLPA